MTEHTLAVVVGVLYIVQLGALFATPVPAKRPWTFERKFTALLRLVLNVFFVWLVVTVVFP